MWLSSPKSCPAHQLRRWRGMQARGHSRRRAFRGLQFLQKTALHLWERGDPPRRVGEGLRYLRVLPSDQASRSDSQLTIEDPKSKMITVVPLPTAQTPFLSWA